MKTVAALPRVIGISLLVGGATYAGTYLIKRTYQSDEVFYFPQAQASNSPLQMLKDAGGSGGEDGSVSLLNGMLNSPNVGAGPQTASGIVTSHTAIRDCVDQLGLDKSWGLSKDEAYDQLDKWTDAKVDKNGMLDVTATAESPDEAVNILKNLEGYLSKRSDALTVNVSHSNRVYLEQRVADAEKQVNKIQQQLVDTMRTSPLADIDDLMKSYFAAREDLQKAQVAEVAGASRLAALEKDSKRLAAAGDSFPNNLITMSTLNTDLKALSDEIQTRQIALQDAMTNFTKDSPEYKTAIRNAANTEKISKSLVSAGKQAVNSGLTPQLIQAHSDLDALKSSSDQFAKILADFESKAIQAPKQYADVSRMKLEFNGAMKDYGLLREQLEMAKLAESRDPMRFAVLDQPFPNPKPVGPRRGLISAVAFILAGLFQLAFNSLREDSDETDGPAELNGHRRRREVPSEEAVAKVETPRQETAKR